MQQLQVSISAAPQPADCAAQLLATVPLLMRFIREHMRRHRAQGLSVPQFRALVFANCVADATLSQLAEHLGLSLPAASRLVTLLVARGLLRRAPRPGNRRCVVLSLTARGRAAFQAAYRRTHGALAERLANLPTAQLRQLCAALAAFGQLFDRDSPARGGASRRGRKMERRTRK
jgi:DNA-binding MarR family transcriptional regulator